MAEEELLRSSIISSVMDRARTNGGFVTRADLSFVALPTGEGRRAIDERGGIWNPRDLDATLSVVSSPNGPYADRQVEGGLFHYSYRAGSTQGSNAKLRIAHQLGLPIILLMRMEDGFVPLGPVYVVEDLVEAREFLIDLGQSLRLNSDDLDTGGRRYTERVVKQRLHQAQFRGRVIAAYQTTCAICRLRHGELLDAAHITPDRDEGGLPAVSNGLSLCKIHHAAFDMNMLGISPDYQVRIDSRLLDEVDGPMLLHGLQEMHGAALIVPQRPRDRPDRERLEARFSEFLRQAS